MIISAQVFSFSNTFIISKLKEYFTAYIRSTNNQETNTELAQKLQISLEKSGLYTNPTSKMQAEKQTDVMDYRARVFSLNMRLSKLENMFRDLGNRLDDIDEDNSELWEAVSRVKQYFSVEKTR